MQTRLGMIACYLACYMYIYGVVLATPSIPVCRILQSITKIWFECRFFLLFFNEFKSVMLSRMNNEYHFACSLCKGKRELKYFFYISTLPVLGFKWTKNRFFFIFVPIVALYAAKFIKSHFWMKYRSLLSLLSVITCREQPQAKFKSWWLNKTHWVFVWFIIRLVD